MSGKGLEQVEPPMYELDQNRLGQFEVGLSWLEGQPRWPELAVRQEVGDALGTRLRVAWVAWRGVRLARAEQGMSNVWAWLTLREVSRGGEIERAGATTALGVRAYD